MRFGCFCQTTGKTQAGMKNNKAYNHQRTEVISTIVFYTPTCFGDHLKY